MVSFISSKVSNICKIKLSDLLFDIFLDSLISEKSEVKDLFWIISPWISDVNFNFIGRSTLSGIFLTPRKSIKLSEILTIFLNCGGNIKIVCRPPHDLIDISYIRMLFFLENANFSQKDLIIYRIVDSIVSQKSTIDFLYNLLPYVELGRMSFRFNENLHAKIFASKNCAVTGSSNMTFGGIYLNLEFNCFVTDAEELIKIESFCNEIWEHSLNPIDYIQQCVEFQLLLDNLTYVKDKFDPRLKDLYNKLKTLKDKILLWRTSFN